MVLDDELFKKLKEYSADSGKKIRDILTEAIEAKILKDLDAKNKRSSQSATIEKNRHAQKMLVELERFLTPKTAEVVLIQKCEKHGFSVRELSEKKITSDFIKDICKSVAYVTDNVTADHLEERLLWIVRKESEGKDVQRHN